MNDQQQTTARRWFEDHVSAHRDVTEYHQVLDAYAQQPDWQEVFLSAPGTDMSRYAATHVTSDEMAETVLTSDDQEAAELVAKRIDSAVAPRLARVALDPDRPLAVRLGAMEHFDPKRSEDMLPLIFDAPGYGDQLVTALAHLTDAKESPELAKKLLARGSDAAHIVAQRLDPAEAPDVASFGIAETGEREYVVENISPRESPELVNLVFQECLRFEDYSSSRATAARKMLERIDPQGTPDLALELARTFPPLRRDLAAKVEPTANRRLAAAMVNEFPEVRLTIASHVDPQAAPSLFVRLLKSRDPRVALAAARTINPQETPEYADIALHSRHPAVRQTVADAIEPDVEPNVTRAAHHHRDPKVRQIINRRRAFREMAANVPAVQSVVGETAIEEVAD